MRRTIFALLSLVLFACQGAPKRADEQRSEVEAARVEPAKTQAAPPRPPARTTAPEIVRKDLVAEDLPPVPTLEQLAATELGAGEFGFPEGTDELAPRAALALRDGLLLVGQAYHDRRPGRPPQTWRWAGFVPTSGDPRSTLYDPGAIRAAIAHDGGGLLAGSRGVGFDVRGWFATVTPDGTIQTETALDSPSATEMFDLVPGRGDEELAVVAGYVDAQGWLLSLDAAGNRRWEKFIGSYGYTQVRGLARLVDGDLLAIGARAKGFGEGWSAKVPGDGGESAAADDVVQTKVEIVGADPNMVLRAIVDLGQAGFVALGTAKRNYLQAHDQLLAVGFDRSGAVSWSRVVDGVRVSDVLGSRVEDGAAQFVVGVPTNDEPQPAVALALVTVPADPSAAVLVRRIADTDGWASAGFVEGAADLELITFRASEAGMQWRRLTVAK